MADVCLDCQCVSSTAKRVHSTAKPCVTACAHLPLQDDWESYTKMTEMMSSTQIVGDDLLVTNVERIATGSPILVLSHTHAYTYT